MSSVQEPEIRSGRPSRDQPDASPRAHLSRMRAAVPWPMVGALVLLTAVLLPARDAALRYDDVWNSEKRGLLDLLHQSLPSYLWGGIQAAWRVGRPQFLGGQGDIVEWTFDGTPLAYHIYLVVLTVAAGALLWMLARRLGMSTPGATLVLVILAGAIQFRAYHDPVLGYYGTTQLVLILTLASLLAFLTALQRRDRRAYMVAFLLMAPCPLLYEFSYTLVLAHLGLALHERRGRAALRAALPFLGLGAFFVILSAVARHFAPQVPDGYTVSVTPLAIIRTYVTQLFPPLPGSSVLFDPKAVNFEPGLDNLTKAELLAGLWRGAAVFALVLALSVRLLRALPSPDRLLRTFTLGALLWLSAPMLLALAPKYQTELSSGRGYLPVLIQVFGFALVAAALLTGALSLAARRGRAASFAVAGAAAAVLAGGALLNGLHNVRVIAMEQPVVQSRTLLNHAASDGEFATVPQRSTLLFNLADMQWQSGSWQYGQWPLESMLVHRAHRLFDGRLVAPDTAFGCPAPREFPPVECAPLADQRAWVRVRPHRGGGSVLVAPIAGAGSDFRVAMASSLRVYVRGEGGTPPPPVIVGVTARNKPWRSDRVAWRPAARGDGWALYDGSFRGGSRPVAASLDDAAGTLNFLALPPPGQVVRVYGTKGLLP